MIRLPAGSTANEYICPFGPFSGTHDALPVLLSSGHKRTASSVIDAIHLPSGLNATDRTGRVSRKTRADRVVRGQKATLARSVIATHDELGAKSASEISPFSPLRKVDGSEPVGSPIRQTWTVRCVVLTVAMRPPAASNA